VLELTSRLARLFWEALDRVDYAVTYVKCWAVDLIYGPEPPTSADKQREAEHARLKEAFPAIGLNGTVTADGELPATAETGAIGAARVSDPTPPRAGAAVDRHVGWCPAFDVTGLPHVSVSASRSHTPSLSIQQKIKRKQSKPRTQRDMMREILDQVGHNEQAACALYVQAEQAGRVMRLRNASGMSPSQYAAALWRDAHRSDRPWIIEYCRKRGIKVR
jgi:hypothetical protein